MSEKCEIDMWVSLVPVVLWPLWRSMVVSQDSQFMDQCMSLFSPMVMSLQWWPKQQGHKRPNLGLSTGLLELLEGPRNRATAPLDRESAKEHCASFKNTTWMVRKCAVLSHVVGQMPLEDPLNSRGIISPSRFGSSRHPPEWARVCGYGKRHED